MSAVPCTEALSWTTGRQRGPSRAAARWCGQKSGKKQADSTIAVATTAAAAAAVAAAVFGWQVILMLLLLLLLLLLVSTPNAERPPRPFASDGGGLPPLPPPAHTCRARTERMHPRTHAAQDTLRQVYQSCLRHTRALGTQRLGSSAKKGGTRCPRHCNL